MKIAGTTLTSIAPGRIAERLIAWASSLRRHPHFVPVAVLVAMPLVMAMLGRDWLYTSIGYLDPWYNVGFFLFYHDNTFLADHYKLQRLPWILPGWILYHVLGPLVANFVLHIGALVVSTVFVYLGLARLVSKQSAFVVAAFLTVYIPFHGSGGWDYQAAGAGAYYAITFYLVTRAAQAANPQDALIGAGVAYAAAIFATIQFVNFAPFLAALYFIVGERHRTLDGAKAALRYSLIGFVFLTIVLCAVNVLVGRGPFFFWPLLKIVLERVADPVGQKPWLLPWSAFFVRPHDFLYLVMPIAVFVCSLLRLTAAVLGIGQINSVRAFLLLQYVLLCFLWVLWQQLGHTALWPAFFAHPLQIPAFLALGGLLGGNVDSEAKLSRALCIGAVLLSVIPAIQGAIGPQWLHSLESLTESQGTLAVGGLVVAAILFASVASGARSWGALLCGAMSFTFGYLQIESRWAPVDKVGRVADRFWPGDPCISNEKTYREIVRLFRIFRSENPVLWQTWLWRGPAGARTFPSGCVFDPNNLRGSVHSTGVSNLGLPTDVHPRQITDEYANYIVDRGLVVAIVERERDADGLVESLAARGKNLTLIRRETIDLGKLPFVVLIYRSRNAS